MAGLTQAQRDALASDGDEEDVLEGAVDNPVEDAVIDGRMSGLVPNYRREELDTDTSAAEAEEQSHDKPGGA